MRSVPRSHLLLLALPAALAGVALAAPAAPARATARAPLAARQALPEFVEHVASRSPILSEVQDLGPAPGSFRVKIAVGLELRDKADLESYIHDASDPASPIFQDWLSQDEFNALYGPSVDQERRVIEWLTDAGFDISQTFANHMLVVAEGDAADVESAFQVQVHRVRFKGENHYAVMQAPRFPADIAAFTSGVIGLDDLGKAKIPGPKLNQAAVTGVDGYHMSPPDLVKFYDNDTAYTGKGRTHVIAGFYAWQDTDVTAYNSQFGLPPLPAGSIQICNGTPTPESTCGFNRLVSTEITLDVEMSHAAAPDAVIVNYEALSDMPADFAALYNAVATHYPGATVSHSIGMCESNQPNSNITTADNIIASGVAQGQSWFVASGDSGSAMSSQCIGKNVVAFPADLPHVVAVGGTTPTCSSGMDATNPACGGFGSEAAWSGSGGGKSRAFPKPAWQSGCGVPADGGRDVPDISLASDVAPGMFMYYNGKWMVVGGTSDAAPYWGGIFADLNQKKGGAGLGLPNGRLYQMCNSSSFHDVITGSNGGYSAKTGYDQVTGIGSPDEKVFLANY